MSATLPTPAPEFGQRPAVRLLAQDSVLVDVDRLVPHPENPNDGDDGAVYDSLTALGWWGGVVAQVGTHRILAGHTRVRAAKAAGLTQLPGFWLNVDDETARRILLSDNRTSQRASARDDLLLGLLDALARTDRGLAGTAYDLDDLDRLVREAGNAVLGQKAVGPAPLHGADADTLAAVAPPSVRQSDSAPTPRTHVCPECGHEWAATP